MVFYLQTKTQKKKTSETQEMVVFCTTCKGRSQHIKATLPLNLKHNPKAKFVLVNYNSPDDLQDYIKRWHQKDINSGQLVFYNYYEPEKFHMAHAKNMAHRLGIREGGDILCNLDADNYTGEGFTEYIEQEFKTPDTFLYAEMVKGVLPRGISGRIVVTRQQFLNAGGYDEKYNTYSPDDKDFNARLLRLGYKRKEIDNKFLIAIRHTDKMRYKEYPETKDVDEDSAWINQTNKLVNHGYVGCGTVYKNFGTFPIHLKPIPTKIFGIGLHKTATTSLSKALTLLGYKSGHWETAKWAKFLYKQTIEKDTTILDKYNAVCDLPVPLIYKQLDKLYPNSKFILTLRDENNWIESVRKHWSNTNPFRHQWDTDVFTHKVHKMLYGQTEFNEQIFLNRYRQHTKEVKDYFKHREQDLLIMYMDQGADWNELCTFLDQPVPNISYPREFITQEPVGCLPALINFISDQTIIKIIKKLWKL